MQKLAAQAWEGGAFVAVGRITRHGVADRREVHAQLMGPARQQQRLEQRPAREA